MKSITHFKLTSMIYCLVLCLLCCSLAQAQKKKEKRQEQLLLKEFIEITNLYKQLPVYSEFEIKRSSNLITAKEDTGLVYAKSYVDKRSCYLKIGAVEHLLNDSLSLMTDTDIQRMCLYQSNQSVQHRVSRMNAFAFNDSSLESMLSKYEAKAFTGRTNNTAIVLDSRSNLYSTPQPKETIKLVYDRDTRLPVEMVSIKRFLLPLSEESFAELSKQDSSASLLVSIDAKRFLIKEQATSILFHKISYQQSSITGTTINDRLQKNQQGEYLPTKSYEGYTVTVN